MSSSQPISRSACSMVCTSRNCRIQAWPTCRARSTTYSTRLPPVPLRYTVDDSAVIAIESAYGCTFSSPLSPQALLILPSTRCDRTTHLFQDLQGSPALRPSRDSVQYG